MLLSSVVYLTRSSLGRFQGILRLFVRRRRYTPVVTGHGLAIANGEVHTSRILKSLVRLIGPLGNRASTCLAKRMSTRRAVGAEAQDPGKADMAGPHSRRVDTVCSIEFRKDFG